MATAIGKFTIVCSVAITAIVVGALVIASLFLTWRPT
jgi:hypothetical protein